MLRRTIRRRIFAAVQRELWSRNVRQHDSNQQSSTGSEDSIWTVLPVALIVVLTVGIITMSVLKTFNFGPAVGDMIVFRSQPAAAGAQRNDVSVTRVARRDGRPGAGETCSLDPSTMGRLGGSLVVEKSITAGRAMLQVHWAGHQTSAGAQDCGAVADLLVQPNDLLDLAGSAGGFGPGHMALSPTTFGTVPTMLD